MLEDPGEVMLFQCKFVMTVLSITPWQDFSSENVYIASCLLTPLTLASETQEKLVITADASLIRIFLFQSLERQRRVLARMFPLAKVLLAWVLLYSRIPLPVVECANTGPSNGYSSRSYYTVKERHDAPRSWVPVGRAPAAHELELRIGLRQARFLDLERSLFES